MSGLDGLHGEIGEDLQRTVGDCAPIRCVHVVDQLFDEAGKQLAGDQRPDSPQDGRSYEL